MWATTDGLFFFPPVTFTGGTEGGRAPTDAEIADLRRWTHKTIRRVTDGASIAPMLPPAMMKPNRRVACTGRKMSAMKLQKIDTTNRLKTLNHT